MVIKQRFVLDEARRSFLDLTARTKWTDVRLSVGGTSLGPPLSRADLRDGQSYTLADGSELLIQLEMPFLMPTLRIERDGMVVPGSDASPESLSERAGRWLIGIGVLNFLLGFGATSMSMASMRNAFFLVGVFFVATGFFARRGSLPALVLGTGLFFLGALQGLSNANMVTIVLQIAILTPMFRALYAHYLDRTSAARPLRRDHVPLAVVKSAIRPRTEFAETIAPSSRPRMAGPGLAGASGVGGAVPGPVAAPPAVAPALIAPAPGGGGAEPSDSKFGPYVVTGTLGSGGMATVYRARQTSVGRDVALKVITGNHNAEPEFGERFRREAETTARLSHPHILKVFDFGEEAGRPYLAMEYMSGGTLRGRIGASALPVAQVLKWAEQVGQAIHSAHTQGVVHRDRQARERSARSNRQRIPGRLRPRAAQQRQEQPDPDGNADGEPVLHVAGAVGRGGGDRGRGPVCVWDDALRVALRQPALSRRDPPCAHGSASQGPSAVDPRVAAKPASRDGHLLRQGPEQGAGSTLFRRRGHGRCVASGFEGRRRRSVSASGFSAFAPRPVRAAGCDSPEILDGSGSVAHRNRRGRRGCPGRLGSMAPAFRSRPRVPSRARSRAGGPAATDGATADVRANGRANGRARGERAHSSCDPRRRRARSSLPNSLMLRSVAP